MSEREDHEKLPDRESRHTPEDDLASSAKGSPRETQKSSERVPLEACVRIRPFQSVDNLGPRVVKNADGRIQIEVEDTDKLNQYIIDHAWWSATNWDSNIPVPGVEGEREVAARMTNINQEAIFSSIGGSILRNLLNGQATVLLGMGQNKSGKTYTLFGPDLNSSETPWFQVGALQESWGIFPRIAKQIFEKKQNDWTIKLQYVQDFGRTIRDLLSESADDLPSTKTTKLDDGGYPFALNCQFKECSTWEELCSVLKSASARKYYAPTKFDERTTIGHSILNFQVETPHYQHRTKRVLGRLYVCEVASVDSQEIFYAEYEAVQVDGQTVMQYKGKHPDAGKSKDLLNLTRQISTSINEMRQLLLKVGKAVKSERIESITHRSSYFLVRLLQETLLKAKTYAITNVFPEKRFGKTTKTFLRGLMVAKDIAGFLVQSVVPKKLLELPEIPAATRAVDDSRFGDDHLGYLPYAKALAAAVRSAETPERSLAVGLFARWGAGKSFIMEKLKEELESVALRQAFGASNIEGQVQDVLLHRCMSILEKHERRMLMLTFLRAATRDAVTPDDCEVLKRCAAVVEAEGGNSVELHNLAVKGNTEHVRISSCTRSKLSIWMRPWAVLWERLETLLYPRCSSKDRAWRGALAYITFLGSLEIFLRVVFFWRVRVHSKLRSEVSPQRASEFEGSGGVYTFPMALQKNTDFGVQTLGNMVNKFWDWLLNRSKPDQVLPLLHALDDALEKDQSDKAEEPSEKIVSITYPITVEFNAWVYNGSDVLWAGLVKELFERVEDVFGSRKVREYRAWVGRVLSSNDGRWPTEILECSPEKRARYIKRTVDSCKQSFGRARERNEMIVAWVMHLAIIWVLVASILLRTVFLPQTSEAEADSSDDLLSWAQPLVPGLASLIALKEVALRMYDYFKNVRAFLVESQGIVLYEKAQQLSKRSDMSDKLGFMNEVKTELMYLYDFLQSVPLSENVDFRNGRVYTVMARLSVYVDDIDRCEPQSIVSVLQAAILLLVDAPITCCLAIDARMVTTALEDAFGETFRRSGHTGYEFLDKIVQLPFTLPAPALPVQRHFLHGLVSRSKGLDAAFFRLHSLMKESGSNDLEHFSLAHGETVTVQRLANAAQIAIDTLDPSWKGLMEAEDGRRLLRDIRQREVSDSQAAGSLIDMLNAWMPMSLLESKRDDAEIVAANRMQELFSQNEISLETNVGPVGSNRKESKDLSSSPLETPHQMNSQFVEKNINPGLIEDATTHIQRNEDRENDSTPMPKVQVNSKYSELPMVWNFDEITQLNSIPSREDRDKTADSVDSRAFPQSSLFNTAEAIYIDRLSVFIRSNPRHIKRVVNSYTLQRFVLDTQLGFPAVECVKRKSFTLMLAVEQWPARMAILFALVDAHESIQTDRFAIVGQNSLTKAQNGGLSILETLSCISSEILGSLSVFEFLYRFVIPLEPFLLDEDLRKLSDMDESPDELRLLFLLSEQIMVRDIQKPGYNSPLRVQAEEDILLRRFLFNERPGFDVTARRAIDKLRSSRLGMALSDLGKEPYERTDFVRILLEQQKLQQENFVKTIMEQNQKQQEQFYQFLKQQAKL